MTGDKLREMIEKLKKQQPEKVEEKKESPKQEVQAETPKEVQKESPKQPSEEEMQRIMFARRMMELQNNGLYRFELLGEIEELTKAVNTLNEILIKALGIDKN